MPIIETNCKNFAAVQRAGCAVGMLLPAMYTFEAYALYALTLLGSGLSGLGFIGLRIKLHTNRTHEMQAASTGMLRVMSVVVAYTSWASWITMAPNDF